VLLPTTLRGDWLRLQTSQSLQPAVENLDKVENADSTDFSAEPKPIKHSSKEGRQKNEDESQRLRRIIAICAGC
jgi:hypothetical protein